MKTYRSFSSEQTKKLGAALAKKLSKEIRGKGALVLALKGNLGAGKTTFVQGFFKGLGIAKRPVSPTFIIMRRHSLRRRKHKDVFHVDAYRLKSGRALSALGFRSLLANPLNIILIEWADRARSILPKGAHWIAFEYGKKENERRIIMRP